MSADQLELTAEEEYHYPHMLRDHEIPFGRQAYKEGAEAKRAGLPMEPKRYANTILTRCWLNGWNEAEAPLTK